MCEVFDFLPMALELRSNTALAFPSSSTFMYMGWAPYKFHSSCSQNDLLRCLQRSIISPSHIYADL